MKRSAKKSPVRDFIDDSSRLQPRVQDGLGAVKSADRDCFDDAIRTAFADSLHLDAALQAGRERERRWDYLLGHEASGLVVAVEPHVGKADEVNAIISKRTAARQQLTEHQRPGTSVARWLWVAPGRVRFAPTDKARRLLDQNGIEFAGAKILAKHLPSAEGSSTGGPARLQRKPKK